MGAHNHMGNPLNSFPIFTQPVPNPRNDSVLVGFTSLPFLPTHSHAFSSRNNSVFHGKPNYTRAEDALYFQKMGNPGMLRAFWRGHGAEPSFSLEKNSHFQHRNPHFLPHCGANVRPRVLLEFPQRIPAADFPVLGRGSSFRRALKHPRGCLGAGDDNPKHSHNHSPSHPPGAPGS